MKRVLVDTDVFVNFLRGREGARRFLVSLSGEAEILCSAVSVAELESGIRKGEETATRSLLDLLDVADVTRGVATKAGEYRRAIRSHRLELADCLVAATAFERRAVLATCNGKHYPMKDIRVVVVPAG